MTQPRILTTHLKTLMLAESSGLHDLLGILLSLRLIIHLQGCLTPLCNLYAVCRMQPKQHRSCRSAMLCYARHQTHSKAQSLVPHHLLPCCRPTVTKERHSPSSPTARLHIHQNLFPNGHTRSCQRASRLLSNRLLCQQRGTSTCHRLPQ